MTKISQLRPDDRSEYLSLNDPKASEDILITRAVTSRLEVSPSKRVLLIGLGGSGIRVVSRVKAAIQQRFQDYDGRIAFLAMDTDHDDLRMMKNLDPYHEVFALPHLPTPAMGGAPWWLNPSRFIKSWINPSFNPNMNWQGSIGNRHVARLFLHNATDANNPVDEQIVHRIADSLHLLTNGFNPWTMRLEIMIVLGLSGGIGSGGLIDIAQFAHAAVRQHQATFGDSFGLTGYFFTKDVMEWYTLGQPTDAAKAGNCYAALKELDYYMSAPQREPFRKDILHFRSDDLDPVVIDGSHPLYTTVYLVNGNGRMNSFEESLKCVSESIVNSIANVTLEHLIPFGTSSLLDGFYANLPQGRRSKFMNVVYDTNGNENNRMFADDAFNYCAVGVANASVPENELKIYAINLIAQTAFSTGSLQFAPAVAIQSWSMEPFTRTQGEHLISEMLTLTPERLQADLLAKVGTINWPDNFVPLTASAIRAGQTQPAAIALGCEFNGSHQIRTANEREVMDWINSHVEEQFMRFLDAAKSFLLQYGPRAFVNLYRGIAADGSYGGIIEKLCEWGSLSAQDFGRINIRHIEEELNYAQYRVNSAIFGMFPQSIERFHYAFLEYKQMETASKVRDYLLQGLYRAAYLDKIKAFAEAVSEFAFILDQLLNAYSEYSAQLSDFDSFCREANNDAINVNILAQHEDFDWAILETRYFVDQIQYGQVRADLVNSFLENPLAWTDTQGGESPRRLFDRIMAKHLNEQIGTNMIRLGDRLSIVSYLEMEMHRNNLAGLQNCVDHLVSNLVLKAKVRFNKNLDFNSVGECSHKYLIIPNSVTLVDPAIMTAIQHAAMHYNLDIALSSASDRITCFQVEGAIPLYTMRDLSQWEYAYDVAAGHGMLHSNESGKGIYDPETGLAWRAYPEITKPVNGQDPRQPDQMGRVSREGRFMRDVIDPLFEEALKQHIIEREETNNGYTYWYYDLTIPGWDYSIDLRFCPKEHGCYVMGEKLFAMIAEQNYGPLADMHHKIMINNPGFNDETTDEQRALDRAKRALRKNVPMFIAVKRSVIKAKELFAEIDAANEKLMKIGQ